jgi:hypothetical protein
LTFDDAKWGLTKASDQGDGIFPVWSGRAIDLGVATRDIGICTVVE